MQAQKEYLITRRSGAWNVEYGLERRGPYITQQIAIDSAIAMAKADFGEMITAIVWLEDQDKIRPIFDSTIVSLRR
jgi:hypothetical protein